MNNIRLKAPNSLSYRVNNVHYTNCQVIHEPLVPELHGPAGLENYVLYRQTKSKK